MDENLCAGAYAPHRIRTDWKWVDTAGCAHLFELPISYRENLCERLAREFCLRDANLAARLACMIVAMQPKLDGKPFPLDRRGLAGCDREDGKSRILSDLVKALGFTEWTARIAIDALRAVEFVEQWSQQIADSVNTTWARWRRTKAFDPKRGKDFNKSCLRRAANLYVIGSQFVLAAWQERGRRSKIAGRRAWLESQQRLRAESEAKAREIAAIEAEQAAGKDAVWTCLIPDTQQKKPKEEPKAGNINPETPVTLNMGGSPFALIMAVAARTKPGDDLSSFAPGVGPPPPRPEAPPSPPKRAPMLQEAKAEIRPWTPLERALRDLEDGVFRTEGEPE